MRNARASADLNSQDDTGLVWTLPDEAPDPSIIRPGHVNVAGSKRTLVASEVVDLAERPAGKIVPVHVLPLTIKQYRGLLDPIGA